VEVFEFVVKGPPVSLNAKKNKPQRYQKWIRTVRAAAQSQWPAGKPPTLSLNVIVSIMNYYTEAPPDVDNIIKPILDGLETVAYLNDKQVYRVCSERCDISDVATVQSPSALLAEALEQYTELLHVTVTWEVEE
jgi:crossover junction endodeoxyribonuclease RusA